jgi:hypothetical protein
MSLKFGELFGIRMKSTIISNGRRKDSKEQEFVSTSWSLKGGLFGEYLRFHVRVKFAFYFSAHESDYSCFLNRNNTHSVAVRLNKSSIGLLYDLKMISGESKVEDFVAVLARGSRMQRFERDSRRMLSCGKRSSESVRLFGKRVSEERMITNRQIDRNEARRKFGNDIVFRRRQNREISQVQRMLPHNRERSRVTFTEEKASRTADFSNRQESRMTSGQFFSTYKTVGALLPLWCLKVKENLVAVFLSVVFLFDLGNELMIRVRSL